MLLSYLFQAAFLHRVSREERKASVTVLPLHSLASLTPRPPGRSSVCLPPLYFTVTGDILVSRWNGSLPRCSLRQRNQGQWSPKSRGDPGDPAGRSTLTLPPAPMKSGIMRAVSDDKSVSVCPRLFPGLARVRRDNKEGWGLGRQGWPSCSTMTPDPRKRSNHFCPTVGSGFGLSVLELMKDIGGTLCSPLC